MTAVNVIVVEDNVFDVELMLHELGKHGFEPRHRVVQTADEFRRAVQDGADVILADYSLPHFSALDALQIRNEEKPDIPLIVVTGAIGDEPAADCIKRGAADYLLKDRLTRLGPAVRQVVERTVLHEEKRRAETALHESEGRFHAIMDSILDAAMIIDLDGSVLFVNQTARRLFQLGDRRPTDGWRLSDLFAAETHTRMTTDLERVRDGFGGFLGEYEAHTQHGTNRWLEAVCTRIQYRETPAAILIFRDITEHRKMEEVLWESQERYRLLFNQMLNGFALFDAMLNEKREAVDFVFLAVNPAFRTMTGISPEQVLGSTIRKVLPKIDPFWLETLARVASTGEPSHFTGYLRHLDKYFEVSAFSPKKNEVAILLADTTERKSMEEALRRSEEKYRTVADFTHDWEYWMSPAGEYMYLSPSCEDFTGYSADEFQSDPGLMTSLVHPEDRAFYEQHIANDMKAATEACCFDFRIVTRGGTLRWLSHCCRPVFDRDGNWAGRRGSNRDITERKLAESALRESERRLADIIEFLPDATFAIDKDGLIIAWNRAIEEMSGCRAEEMLGKGNHEYTLPFYQDRRPALVDLILHPDPAVERQYAYVRRISDAAVAEADTKLMSGGRPIRIWAKASPLYDSKGKIVGAIETIRDVTDRVRMEERLRQTNQTLATVFQAAPVAIIALDMEGRVKVWNRGAERMFGWPESEAIDHAYRLVPPQHREAFDTLVRSVLQGESYVGVETQRLKSDGSLLDVSISTAPLRNAAGDIAGLMSVIEDITQRKSLEAQLSQAQKLESVGRLAGGVAHDFNNLLTVINGHSELVIAQLLEQDPLRRDIEEIRNAGERAAALTRQLLAFSRKQILQPVVVNLNHIVDEMGKMLPRLIGEHIVLDTVLAPDLGCIRADPTQLGQILMNLSVNARDAMPSGGRLHIQTSNAALGPDDAAEHPGASPGDYIVLEVTDTGTGMDRETKAHLFEPFFTTKEKGKGTGLGLSMVYGIVKQSGGFIALRSEPGQGTSFCIYLPRVSQETPDAAKHETDRPGHGSETILVTEDDDGVRSVIRRTLRKAGYTVLEAKNGDEALSLCEKHTGPIHLAISDMIMPTMSGRQMLHVLTARNPTLKVLLISGYSDDTIHDQDPFLQEHPFLQKPFTTLALAKKVREILDQPGT